MRIVLTFATLALSTFFSTLIAQEYPPQKMYVAHKPGLSIREKPDVNAKVLVKIPYSTLVTVANTPSDTTLVITEGFSSYFRKVTYNGKTGYIIGAYLLPVPPPKPNVRSITDYLAQLSPKSGPVVEVKKGGMNNITEGGTVLKKQLYKNGAEHHQFGAWEYGSDTWFLPDFNIQQAWLLLRLIPDWKNVVDEKTELPGASKIITKKEIEYDIKVEKESWYGPEFFKKIRIEYTEGASYIIEIFMLENQVVIFNASGV
jgi:hypothetical protein